MKNDVIVGKEIVIVPPEESVVLGHTRINEGRAFRREMGIRYIVDIYGPHF